MPRLSIVEYMKVNSQLHHTRAQLRWATGVDWALNMEGKLKTFPLYEGAAQRITSLLHEITPSGIAKAVADDGKVFLDPKAAKAITNHPEFHARVSAVHKQDPVLTRVARFFHVGQELHG